MLAELSLRHSSVILVVFKVTVQLEDDPSAPALSSLVLFFLKKKKKSSISFQRSGKPDQCLCPICRKTAPQHHAAISVPHCRVEQVMNGVFTKRDAQ